MLDTLNLARIIQKFVSKKKSVGYSHPPILCGDRAEFKVHDGTKGGEGRVLVVSVRELSSAEELVAQ